MLNVTMQGDLKGSDSGKEIPPGKEGGISEPSGVVLNETQRNKILYEWNNTRADFPDACAHELFEQQVARNPDAIAVVSAGKSLSYGELNDRANQVANYLRKRGVGPDVLVGVCLQRSTELAVALLGVWKSGGAYVPLDSSYPEERLSFMVGDAAVQVLLTEQRCKHLFASKPEKAVCLDSDWHTIAQENNSNLRTGVTPSNLAYVMYTSGSTGKPKGAMILHRGLVNYLWWAIRTYQVQAGGSVPVHSSISFDLTVTSLYPALISGGQVELLAEDVGAQNLLAALRQRKDRNLVKITPAHLEALGLQLSAEEVKGMTRTFVIGGENLLAESLRLWRESAPETRLINEYGPTETVVGCCVYEVRPEDPRNGSVPIGRPIANTQLYILDERLEPVAPGVMGELYIGGAGVARGYLNRPDLTKERFLADPFSGQGDARMYKTGDLARYREDGIIEYLGRVDNQVKVRGYRIELGEIEAMLASCPSVQSCAVLAREDVPGDKQLVGYVVPRDGKGPNVEELREFLKEGLPEYMVPAKFVYLESFPLTHNGKVDRKALPAPVQDEERVDPVRQQVRTVLEEKLVSIWQDLFKLQNIGIHDDFFELGGHSLLAIKVMARIREEIGVDLQVLNLFENPTIAALTVNLVEAGAKDAPLEPVEMEEPAPVSKAIQPARARQSAEPFFFGPLDKQLYGVYTPPTGEVTRRSAVLFCPSIGLEYMRTHYAIRLVCSQLARAGFPVLRFDYHGTGDSSGNVQAGQFETWIDDIELAANELKKISGVNNLFVAGLRVGATLAVETLVRSGIKVEGCVLWDPVVSGNEYLDQLEQMHTLFLSERTGPLKPNDELLGAHFPQDLRAALRQVNLDDRLRDARIEKMALIVSGDESQCSSFARSLKLRWPEMELRTMNEPADWGSLKAAFGGRMSGPILRAVAETIEGMS
jgi:amino acid adenylation domain-containing protein